MEQLKEKRNACIKPSFFTKAYNLASCEIKRQFIIFYEMLRLTMQFYFVVVYLCGAPKSTLGTCRRLAMATSALQYMTTPSS